jgi:uncharacterized protein (DUF427 family)
MTLWIEDGIEDGQKRVRCYLRGALVADTRRPVLVWEHRYYPAYWLPECDVDTASLHDGAVRRSPDERLRGLVHLDWDALDEWLEEDEPVYVHPRNPYTRVDILASSRHVVVEIDGVRVADSRQPRILFETGLPPRYYLPLTDVRLDLLRPSGATSCCPYKGTATYWSCGDLDDIAWTYRTTLPESHKVVGLVCFYDERVDVTLDGVRQERPCTHLA